LGGESGASNEVSATPSAQGIIKINSGGAAVNPFVADVNFNGGNNISTTNNIDLSWLGASQVAPQAVYQTAHTATSSQPLTYSLSGLLPNAPYHLKLHFAEINAQYTQPGQRLFNVDVNAGRVLSNYDIILRTRKPFFAFMEIINVITDSAGKLTITFTNAKGGDAIINGLEVY